MKIKIIEDKNTEIVIHYSEKLEETADFRLFLLSLKKNLKEIQTLVIKNTVFKKYLKKSQKIKIDLTFCSDSKMRKINLSFRNKDKTTDVLSFPQFDNLRKNPASEDLIFFNVEGGILLGDLLISINVAKKQAKSYGASLKEELWRLFIHGILHLLGYDHEKSPKEEKIMFDLQEKFLKKL